MHFNIEELELIPFADPRMMVKPPAFDFEKDGDKAEELVKVLYEKMLALGGAGLSANQVGLPYRVFVIGNSKEHHAFFNPNVIGVGKEISVMEEGCVSLPGFSLTLRRPDVVALEYQNEKGESTASSFNGIPARVVLHEYDHMEGINFTHHASLFKLRYTLDRWKKRRKKLLRKMANGK